MNENQQSGTKDWPMVPIFGRRKRTREAFHVQPSQTFGICESEETISTTTHFPNKNYGFDNDFELMDIDNEDTMAKTDKRNIHCAYDKIQASTPASRTNIMKKEKEICKSTTTSLYQNKRADTNRKSQVPELMKVKEKHFTSTVHDNSTKDFSSKQNFNNDIKSTESGNKQKSSTRRKPIVPRMLTVTAESLKEIITHNDDMIFALYEVYGMLDSTVCSISGQTAKRFIIKDETGIIRCIFWEIDRPFPQLRRGTSVRCVGRIANDGFQCLSIRTTNQSEVNFSETLLSESREVIEKAFMQRREY